MKKVFLGILTVVLLLYPFLVYFGLHYFSIRWLGLILLGFILSRLLLLRKLPRVIPGGKWTVAAGAFIMLLTIVSNQAMGFKLYPVGVSLSMLIVFANSLRHGPTVIEIFARMHEPDLDSSGVLYTRKVTLVWCLFFILNIIASIYTALYTSLETWMLYNGLISYIIMGLLFAGEFVVRHFVRKGTQDNCL